MGMLDIEEEATITVINPQNEELLSFQSPATGDNGYRVKMRV